MAPYTTKEIETAFHSVEGEAIATGDPGAAAKAQFEDLDTIMSALRADISRFVAMRILEWEKDGKDWTSVTALEQTIEAAAAAGVTAFLAGARAERERFDLPDAAVSASV